MSAELVSQEAAEQMRGKILALEAAMLALPKEKQIEFELKHYFIPGVYMREIFVPRNVVLTGKIHKTEHYCILAKGTVSVANENETKTYHAPAVIHSLPGVKRAIHALEDSVWINVLHNPTNERDLDKIEDIFVTDTYEQFLSFMEQKQIEGGK